MQFLKSANYHINPFAAYHVNSHFTHKIKKATSERDNFIQWKFKQDKH